MATDLRKTSRSVSVRRAAACVAAMSSFAVAAPVAEAGSANVVLGSSAFTLPSGAGFGTVQPSRIFNGGDPSGLVESIHWASWGGATAIGHGLNAIFKPQGGYYGKQVTIELEATDLGHCTANGPLAYRKLEFREPSRPGGRDGKWMSWSGASSICTADGA